MDDDEIESMMYYDFAYFRQRVPRRVPPPSVHYHLVRAVYEVFGDKKDAKTGVPLFGPSSWKKANGVLKDILAGFAADPPGVIFYHQKLNDAGEPMFDQYGIALVDCSRGTNDTECVHKQIITTFGTWCAGIEMSNCLILEFRHRYNHRASERRRAGFPKLGHFDTWLIDKLQRLYELNHSTQFLPGWSNTSDYVDTPEKFDTVPLHSAELGQAMAGIKVGDVKLTADLKYLADEMGLKLPPLPVHGAPA